MKLVLFLGAGFSRPFGLPVMREFYKHALEGDCLDDSDRQFLRELLLTYRGAASMLTQDEDNLEDLLSTSLMMSSSGFERSNYDKLCLLLAKIYGAMPTLRYLGLFKGAFKTLLPPKILREHKLTIITTNYDLIPEFGLKFLGLPPSVPGEWNSTAAASSEMLYSKQSPCVICKLHGSVNWYTNKTDDKSLDFDDGFASYTFQETPEREGVWSIPTACHPDRRTNKTPLIIPPTLYKDRQPTCLGATWECAKDALRGADRLTFIGYSFPASDTYMRYMLGACLAENTNPLRIDIVDPEAPRICSEIRSKGYGDTFAKKLDPTTASWEQTGRQVV